MAGNAVNVGGVVIDIRGNGDHFRTAMAKADQQARTTGRAIEGAMNKADMSIRNAGHSVGFLSQHLGHLVAAGALLHLGMQAVEAADNFSLMRSRIRLVAQEGDNLFAIEEKLAQQAFTNRADLRSTVTLYTRLRAARKDLSDEAARDLVDKWSKTLIISAASATEAASSTMQFSQAMAAGVLRGQELNSILQGNSRFAIALADGMGVAVGELKALGEEGKLTSDVILNAIAKAGESIESDFTKKALTFHQAMTNVGTAMIRFVGLLDQSVGASATLASWVNNLSKAIEDLSHMMADGAKVSNRSKELTHELEGAVAAYTKAVLAAAAATGADKDAKAEALIKTKESTAALLKEAEAHLKVAEAIDQSRNKAAELRAVNRAAPFSPSQSSQTVQLRREIETLKNTLAGEQFAAAIPGFVNGLMDKMGIKRSGPKKEPLEEVVAATEASVSELSGYYTELEQMERDLADIRTASAEGAQGGSRAAVLAIIDYYEATDDLVTALERVKQLQGEVLDESDVALLGRLLRPKDGENPFANMGDIEGSQPRFDFTAETDQWDGYSENVRDATHRGLMQAIESGDWGDSLAQIIGDSATDGLSRAIDVFLDALNEIDWGSLFGNQSSGTGWGGFFSAISTAWGGGKAGGGPVSAGKAYTVGEMGSETFVPNADGFIVPNMSRTAVSGAGNRAPINVGGTSIVINGNADSVTVRQLEAALAAHRRAIPSAVQGVIADRRIREGW